MKERRTRRTKSKKLERKMDKGSKQNVYWVRLADTVRVMYEFLNVDYVPGVIT